MQSREELWQQMADMTLAKCLDRCHSVGSCCSKPYCDMAREEADKEGVELPDTDGDLLLDRDGRCVAAPHLRPLCSLQQCMISGMGFDPNDKPWTARYFQLREQLNDLECRRMEKVE